MKFFKSLTKWFIIVEQSTLALTPGGSYVNLVLKLYIDGNDASIIFSSLNSTQSFTYGQRNTVVFTSVSLFRLLFLLEI